MAARPSGVLAATYSRKASPTSAGSWSATSRKETLACAARGMMVLEPGPGVAAPHPVDLGGRPGPDPLQRAEALLAVGRATLARLGEPPLLVERQPGQQVSFLLRQRQYPVVEPGQGDPALLVVQPGQQARHCVQRVGHAAAERAGVQVPVRPGHVNSIGISPRMPVNGRHAGGPHRRVADHDQVARQPRPLVSERSAKCSEPDSSSPSTRSLRDLRRLRPSRSPSLHAEGVDEQLALVVGGAGAQQLAVALGGLERRTVDFAAARPAARRGGRRPGRWGRRGPRPAIRRRPRAARRSWRFPTPRRQRSRRRADAPPAIPRCGAHRRAGPGRRRSRVWPATASGPR